jgi:MFS family permease
MNMMIILRGWLVVEKWDNAAYLGYLMATVALPMLVLSPLAGVVTDRVDKRQLLLAAQAVLVFANSVVTVLILTDTIEFWHLMAVSMLSGSSFAFNMPARQALVAQLVPRNRLMNAVSLTTGAMNASRIVAPTIGGLLVAPIGIGGAYIVSTLFYCVAMVTTFALPALPAEKREREFTFLEDFQDGFRYILARPVLLGLLLFGTVPMLFAMPYQTLLPVFAERVWNVGSAGFGFLQAASGTGGLIGAFVVANLDMYPKKTRLLMGGALALGGSLLLFAVAPSYALGLIFVGAVGFGSMVVMTVNNTSIQLVIPDNVRGRVMSVMMMSFGLMPLGALPAGVMAEEFGARPVVAVAAVAFVAVATAIFLLIPAFRTLNQQVAEGQERERERMAHRTGEAEPGGPPPVPVAGGQR